MVSWSTSYALQHNNPSGQGSPATSIYTLLPGHQLAQDAALESSNPCQLRNLYFNHPSDVYLGAIEITGSLRFFSPGVPVMFLQRISPGSLKKPLKRARENFQNLMIRRKINLDRDRKDGVAVTVQTPARSRNTSRLHHETISLSEVRP